ncbi:MAG: sugar phosphate isomerase/epimerase [Bryobacterales bacterium]|nr:sugar phosphate isomerase/epimerase [Bryobacterales bacterium]
MTRRSFSTLSTASLATSALAAPSHSPIRLGGPIFLKSSDPRELAREHRRLGYSAAYCPPAEVEDTARIKAIVEAYAAEKVTIAEVGAWKNMLDPDPAARAANLAYVQRRLALADAVGAACCVDIAGSFHPTVWYAPHPRNVSREFFDATVENCRKVIDAVKPTRTSFTIEMMGWNLPDSADAYLELMKAIDRKAFAVHVDVCNIINSPRRFYDNAAVTRDVFAKLGRWVKSVHAKDLAFVPEMNVHFVEVIPGRGQFDYKAQLAELAKLPQAPPLMLEHLKGAAEYDEGRAYIQRVAAEMGHAVA